MSVRVEDVVDRESLRAYLNALPKDQERETSVRVAFRAAARVLPIVARNFLASDRARNSDLTPVANFGCLSILGSALNSSNPDIANAATAAYAAAIAAADAAADAVAGAAADAAYAAANAALDAAANAANVAANAAATAAANAANVAANAAATAAATAANAAFAAAFAADPWADIRADLSGDTGAIWVDGVPSEAKRIWAEAKDAMQAHSADWSFWIAWYERVLEGRDWHADAVGAVLLKVGEDDWEKGAAHINPMFDEVLGLYATGGAKAGEVIQVNEAGEFFAEAVTALPKEIHAEAIDRVSDAIAELRAEVLGSQSRFGCMIDVLATLERWLDWYDDRPLRLYEKLADAMDRVAEIALDNGLQDDAAIRVLLREIERSRTDLRANDPQIEARVRRRVRVRYDEMDEPQKVLFQNLVAAGADASVPALRQEMNEDLPVIQNPDAPNDEKERALVREAERAIQMRQLSVEGAAKKAKEFNEITKAGGTIASLMVKLWGFFA